MENRRTNGSAISAIRKALGVRQDALAAGAGITKAYMSQIEHGLRQPAPDVTVKIAARLGTTLDAITYPVSDVASDGSAA